MAMGGGVQGDILLSGGTLQLFNLDFASRCGGCAVASLDFLSPLPQMEDTVIRVNVAIQKAEKLARS